MKKVIIAVVIVLALIVGGGVWFAMKTMQALNDNGISVGKDGVSVDVNGAKVSMSGDGISAESSDGMKASIKDGLLNMLSGSTAVKCAVEDEAGKYTVTAKMGKVRIEGIDYAAAAQPNNDGKEQKGTMIATSEMFYMWSGKEGMKWNIKEMEELSKKMGGENAPVQEPEAADWSDWAKSMEASGAKYDCSPSMVTDADFTPPTDVKFQDFGETMKQFSNMGAQMQLQGQGGPDGGFGIPSGAFPQ